MTFLAPSSQTLWMQLLVLMLLKKKKKVTIDATGHEAFVFCLVSSSTQEEICEAKHSLQGQLVPEERTRGAWAPSSTRDLLGCPVPRARHAPQMKRECLQFQKPSEETRSPPFLLQLP